MLTRVPVLAALALAAAIVGQVHAATTVVVPDPAPSSFTFFGAGDASVTYDGVVFSQSAALSNGNFFNVGVAYSGSPAVLSSQEQSTGMANILVTLPGPVKFVSIDYGTFDAGPVTFELSDGTSFSQPGTSSGYATPGIFSFVASTPITSVLVTEGNLIHIESVTYSAVPETATWTLMIAGFVGLGAALRLGRRKAATVAI